MNEWETMTPHDAARYYFQTIASPPNAWGQHHTPCGLRSDVFFRKMSKKFGTKLWDKILADYVDQKIIPHIGKKAAHA